MAFISIRVFPINSKITVSIIIKYVLYANKMYVDIEGCMSGLALSVRRVHICNHVNQSGQQAIVILNWIIELASQLVSSSHGIVDASSHCGSNIGLLT